MDYGMGVMTSFFLLLMLLGAVLILKIIFSILPKFKNPIYYIPLGAILLGGPFLYPLTLNPRPISTIELLGAIMFFAPSGAIYGWIYYRKMSKKKQ